VLSIDIDRFKLVNDRFGHESGDTVLRQVAAELRGTLRPTDFAARLGGDEFGVLLAGATEYESLIVGERLRDAVECFTDPEVTISIGVAQCNGDLRGTLLAADTALHWAKSSGRNTIKAAGER
jgi:diguanylate cyclase (GGDEF)-like protein